MPRTIPLAASIRNALRVLVAGCALAFLAGACRDEGSRRGQACTAVADCGELRCTAALGSQPHDLASLPLICADPIGTGEVGQPCDTAQDCAAGLCLLSGACAEPCADGSDCGAEQRCQQAFARAGGEALQHVSTCVDRVNLPSTAGAQVTRASSQLGKGLTTLELEATPSGAIAQLAIEHPVAGWPQNGRCRPALCIRALDTRDPTPRTLFNADTDYREAPAPLNPVATGDHLDPPVLRLPSADPGALSPAGYSLTLETEQPGELHITRITHVPAGAGRLDLNLFYVGARDLAPEGTRGPPLVAQALDEVDRIFAQADVQIGEVRQILVGGELLIQGTDLPDGDPAAGFAVLKVRYGVYIELPSLFRLSAGAHNSAVNLFFVSDIAPLTGDGEPQAEAGGAPGPLGMHGTGSSGIAIATDMMAGDAQRLGRTLAHELGHYLGLFHTSEADGRVLDGLTDTPECRSDRDVARDGLDARDCAGAGADNLMFWSVTSGTTLTAEQSAVLRSAVVLH